MTGNLVKELLIRQVSCRSKEYVPHPLGKNPVDFWCINTKSFKGAHFAVYPEELVVSPVLSSTRPGDVVINPFIGSGTTGVVAKKLGRKYLGCDINPNYVKMAMQRVEQTEVIQSIQKQTGS